MKSTGIIMSGDHPVKIMNGIKTVTRRVIKPQPNSTGAFIENGIYDYPSDEENAEPTRFINCSYGKVGDQLWVRETWAINPLTGKPIYRADFDDSFEKPLNGWKPSIHMFKKYSRITLTISDISPERLHDITEEDAIAEGVSREGNGWHNYVNPGCIASTAKSSFISLWQHIHLWKYEPNRWESNPWVWRIKFSAIAVTIK